MFSVPCQNLCMYARCFRAEYELTIDTNVHSFPYHLLTRAFDLNICRYHLLEKTSWVCCAEHPTHCSYARAFFLKFPTRTSTCPFTSLSTRTSSPNHQPSTDSHTSSLNLRLSTLLKPANLTLAHLFLPIQHPPRIGSYAIRAACLK